jgi:hypothetical protein
MSGNRESKMNILFIYLFNIHIHFLNLKLICNERRRFSRDESNDPRIDSQLLQLHFMDRNQFSFSAKNMLDSNLILSLV